MKPAVKPWMKFYPSDWRADAMLRLCSIGARGLWAEMMCIMHEAEPYGSLLVNGKRIDKRQLAGLCGVSEKECAALLLELELNGVFSRDDDGTIYSRRMRRDAQKATVDKENGKLGGNPKVKGGVNPPVNGGLKAQRPEARDQKDSEADASGADAPVDHRKRLFSEGLPKLARLTGKGQDSCRAFVAKCLKAAGDDAVVVLGLIDDAERNQSVDPSAYIVSRLKPAPNFKGNGNGTGNIIQASDDLLDTIRGFDAGPADGQRLRGIESAPNVRLLSKG